MPIAGALVKGMIGGALKERAKNVGKTKVGKLLAREGRVMTGKPQPKAQIGAPAPVQPQQTLAPAAPTVGGGGGSGKFKTEKEAALSLRTSTIEVATLLKGSYVLEKEQLKTQRKDIEEEKRKSDEDALEGEKTPGFNMPKMPGGGLVDKVFGFVGQLIFGTVMMKLVDFLPTIASILPTLGRIADFVISSGLFIVNVLGTFINWGYKLVDGMESMVKGIFGEEGAEKFKTFMTNVKDLISAFLVWKILGQKIVTALVKNIKFAFNIAKGIVTNAFKLVNFITGGAAQKGLTVVTKGLTKVGSWIGKKTGITAAKKLGGSLFKHGAKRAGKRILLKMFGKTFVKTAQGIFGRVPIVGPLIVGLVSLVSGEPIGKALFKTFGAALGGFLGGIAGAAITAAIGTVTAGIGLVLVPIITPASMMIGEILGTFVGDMLYGLIFGGGLSGVGKALKNAFTGIFEKIVEGLKWLVELPIISQLIQIVQNPGEAIWNFGKWVFFEAIPWVMEKLGGAAKLLKEWFDAGVKRFIDNFPVFDLPLMKFGIPWTPIQVNINWLLGKSIGQIPWFKQWVNGEDELMHFPDFSMFIPLLGLPFLVGHIGKSLFPKSFFESWPSGVSSFVNPIGKGIAETFDAKLNENKDDTAKDDSKTQVEKDALVEINQMDKATARKILKLKKKKMDVGRDILQEKDPAKKEALKLEQNALSMKIRKLKGESTDSSSNVLDYTKGGSTYETKLTTANQQGGAKAVIESISTTASYEEGAEPEVIPLSSTKGKGSTGVDEVTVGAKGGAVLINSGSGGDGSDPYEALYKGG